MKNRPAGMLAVSIATWFGCGYFPFGPGTVGSIAAIAIAVCLHNAFGWSPQALGILGVFCVAPGIWASERVAAGAGQKDPGIVVVDEVAGQWITLAGAATLNWKSWLGAFLLFRALDIWKPPPARRMESLPGGIGIMADDVMAGFYGALVLYLAGCFNFY
ncbi:MAG: phosphatidylglycerophosphatase A family protein [Bryobacteraceae bacterium]